MTRKFALGTVTELARRPTKHWRVQGMKSAADVKPLGNFDEIVVGHWLHVEMMDDRRAWVRIGAECFSVQLRRDGSVGVLHTESR
jgi:hypothetical protein